MPAIEYPQNYMVPAVLEPTGMLLLGLGLAGVVRIRKKFKEYTNS
jgi:hypothetical protein